MGGQVSPSNEQDGKLISPSQAPSQLGSDEQAMKGSESRGPGSVTTETRNPHNKYIPRMFDVWALGVCTVLGGQFYGWNEGLRAGFGSYAIGQTLVGFSYVNLALSLSEICSTLSFSGGAYGMTRVVLGFYVGFLVAAFELMEYMTYISAAALYIADFFCEELGWHTNFVPLICFIFYFCMVALVLEGNHIFWRVNKLFAIGIIIIIAWYILGSLQFTNIERYAHWEADDDSIHEKEPGDRQYWFVGGMVAFMRAMPLMTWGFGGIEAMALVTDIIENPRKNVSYGISTAVLTLFVCMMGVMCVGPSLPPGVSQFINAEYFMSNGFELMNINTETAEWLVIPAQFAMGGGFFLPAAKLYHAISESHLVPKFLQVHHLHKRVVVDDASMSVSGQSIHETVTNQHHQWAVIYISLVSYALCLIHFFCPAFVMDSIPILLAQFTYFADLFAYYQLKQVFNTSAEDRTSIFVNPFGVYGAIFSAIMFALVALSVILYSDNDYVELFFAVCYTLLLSVYYFTFAKHQQVFSEEEQKKLLSLHVVTNNRRKKRGKKKMPRKNHCFLHFFLVARNQCSKMVLPSIHSNLNLNQNNLQKYLQSPIRWVVKMSLMLKH